MCGLQAVVATNDFELRDILPGGNCFYVPCESLIVDVMQVRFTGSRRVVHCFQQDNVATIGADPCSTWRCGSYAQLAITVLRLC